MNDNRTEVTIVTASAVLAVLAIVTPLLNIGQPIQFIAVFGGILLGPGSLAYRLATGSKWSECLMVGVALNISALMIVALVAVALHFWHPKVELIIPAVTCVLAMVLYNRLAQDGHRGNGYQRSPR
jgi:uncharacterized membrane protein YoaK (UPF0700 family)